MSDEEINDVVDLQITIEDKTPEVPSFSTLLIAGYHTTYLDLIREYSDDAAMIADGFDDDDPLVKMMTSIKAQDPAPATVKVGRLTNPYTQVVHIIPTITTQGHVYKGKVDGVDWSYTVGAAATLKIIVEAIVALPALTGLGITWTEDDTKVIGTGAAGANHSYSVGKGLKLMDVTADAGLASDLGAIAGEDNEWYGLAIVPQSSAYITAQALYCEAHKKVTIPQTTDWDVVDPSEDDDIASDLVALGYTRTFLHFHRYIGGTEWLGAALLGKLLTLDAGSYTGAFQSLAGITVDVLSAGELTAVKAKRVSKYTRIHGLNLTFEGRSPSGRFIDVTIFADWLYATIQTDSFAYITQSGSGKKVAYTNAGLSGLKGTIEGSLAKGKKNPNPGLDPETQSVVTIPAVAQQAQADRANRIVRGIDFSDRCSGALHGAVIRGRLSI
jgi:hypothetical protein